MDKILSLICFANLLSLARSLQGVLVLDYSSKANFPCISAHISKKWCLLGKTSLEHSKATRRSESRLLRNVFHYFHSLEH